jgi:putative ABC transport system permease protein
MTDSPRMEMDRRWRPSFLWAMARRELRGAFRQFVFFLICITLGVGSLVGVSGFSASLERTIRKEAKSLMAGDVEVRTNAPLGADGLKILTALHDRGIQMTTISEMVAMASASVSRGQPAATQLIELKAVEEGYPFYGVLATAPADAVPALSDPTAALVDEALLVRLGLGSGDRITLGRATFTIAGVITKEPDRVAGAFSLGPRVLIAQRGLPATELVQPGSRVRYRYLLKLPSTLSATALVKELKSALADRGAEITAYDDAQPRLRRFINNMAIYLGLVGLISLLVGGIGVANSVQAFLNGKMETLAIFKCLGADSGTILRIYLLQTLLLGGLGSVTGVALGVGVQWLLPFFLTSFLPSGMEFSLSWLSMLRGMALGLCTALFFSLWPLLGIRRVSPARLVRRAVEDDRLTSGVGFSLSDRRAWLTGAVMVAVLVLLALWQIGSLRIGGTFLGVFAVSLVILLGVARLVIHLVKRSPRPRSLIVRQGLANLYRPGSHALSAVLSVGVGVTVILAIVLVESSLLRQVNENLPTEAPSFFLIDIQNDQREGIERLLAARHIPSELTPIVRMRLHAVGDRTISELSASGELEKKPDAWFFQREYVVTDRETLPPGNRLLRGAWWRPEEPRDHALISVEEDAARHLGIDVGATVVFDVQGRLITATVANIREVHWGNLSTNFFIIFSPGALDGLPMTYIATARTPLSEDVELQRAVVAAFPNVTAINIRHVLDAIRAILERIALVIRFMAVFTVLAGLVVLSGAVATTRFRRLRESVILKTLGATRSVIVGIFAVEYAVLGAVAGVIGASLAGLLAVILLKFFLDLPWQLPPLLLGGGVLIAIGLTVLTGFLTTFRLLGQKPLAVLREE